MYLGRIVELAETTDLYRDPQHQYTRALLSSISRPNPEARKNKERIVLQGDVPSPSRPPSGCPFHPRCPSLIKDARCIEVLPATTRLGAGCFVVWQNSDFGAKTRA